MLCHNSLQLPKHMLMKWQLVVRHNYDKLIIATKTRFSTISCRTLQSSNMTVLKDILKYYLMINKLLGFISNPCVCMHKSVLFHPVDYHVEAATVGF